MTQNSLKVGSTGGGSASYVLLDPVTNKPKANTSYRITLKTANFVEAASGVCLLDDQVAEGTTEPEGQTGMLYLDKQEAGPPALVEGIRAGSYGTLFESRSELGPIIREWYEIQSCSRKSLYRGFSDKQGLTVYLTAAQPCKATLRVERMYGTKAN